MTQQEIEKQQKEKAINEQISLKKIPFGVGLWVFGVMGLIAGYQLSLLWAYFLLMAGVFMAFMDTCAHHYTGSLLQELFNHTQFMDGAISHLNKYEIEGGIVHFERRKKWFGFINVPLAFTDGWHLFKSAMLWCVGLAFADLLSAQYDLIMPYVDFWLFAIISRALIGLTFVLYYSIILKIKR